MKTYNDYLYEREMNIGCAVDRGRWCALPCGHEVSKASLRETGGICPCCEMSRDQASGELDNWPPDQDLVELPGEKNDEFFDDMTDPICDCGEPAYACKCNEKHTESEEILEYEHRYSLANQKE